jgi:ABC-type multidrug transport system ATPase subunit
VIALQTFDVEKRFGRVRALAGVSISIPEASLVRVAGPNGAGKSTLLRVLACLARPTRGRVRVAGLDPFGPAGPAVRARVAWLGDAPALYADLSVRENLEFEARLHGVEPERLDGLAAELGLEAVRDRRAGALSLGFRRRAGLARTLVKSPDLLLLDEPWNGLDAESSQRLGERLRRLRDDGVTAIVASHDEREGLFDMTLRLEAGRVAGFGADASAESAE